MADFPITQTAETGEAVDAIKVDSFPNVTWVSIDDRTREANDDLEDRAATYHRRYNMIVANWNFQGFQDVMSHFAEIYDAEAIIQQQVQEAFEEQLIETVTGASSLHSRPKWNPEQCKEAVSAEALTAAVMTRYHILNYIKRQLGNKLRNAKS